MESITDYVIKAENTAAAALRNAGETVSDGLLIAMVLKGLPFEYKPFVVVVTQNDTSQTFPKFKVALRHFEETENVRIKNDSSIKTVNVYGKNNKPFTCYTCGFTGHKSNECRNKGKLWCKICKSNSHSDKACRTRNVNEHQHAKHMNDGTTHTFQFTLNNFESGAHGIPHNFLLVDTGATSHIVNDASKFIFLDKHFNP